MLNYAYVEDGKIDLGDIYDNVLFMRDMDIFDSYEVQSDGNITINYKDEYTCKYYRRVIVLTNSCDIIHGVRHIRMVPLYDVHDIRPDLEKQVKKDIAKMTRDITIEELEKRFQKKLETKLDQIANNYTIGKAYLPKINIKNFCWDFLIADYTEMFVVSYEYLQYLNKNQREKIKLISPYREYVTNKVGAYVSRVGVDDERERD